MNVDRIIGTSTAAELKLLTVAALQNLPETDLYEALDEALDDEQKEECVARWSK